MDFFPRIAAIEFVFDILHRRPPSSIRSTPTVPGFPDHVPGPVVSNSSGSPFLRLNWVVFCRPRAHPISRVRVCTYMHELLPTSAA